MYCPECDWHKTRVADSRYNSQSRERKRQRICEKCNKHFFTVEKVYYGVLPMVVKRDGKRESFSEEKLNKGVQLALAKSPVSIEHKNNLLTRIMRRVEKHNDSEVSSEWLGSQVMNELRNLDIPAYIRFASVYRDFRDGGSFKQMLEKVEVSEDIKQAQFKFNEN